MKMILCIYLKTITVLCYIIYSDIFFKKKNVTMVGVILLTYSTYLSTLFYLMQTISFCSLLIFSFLFLTFSSLYSNKV